MEKIRKTDVDEQTVKELKMETWILVWKIFQTIPSRIGLMALMLFHRHSGSLLAIFSPLNVNINCEWVKAQVKVRFAADNVFETLFLKGGLRLSVARLGNR